MPVSRPAVSQHLTVLRTAGLEAAGSEELGRWVDALVADARSGGGAQAGTPPTPGHAGGRPHVAASRREKSPVPPDAPKDGGGKKKHGKKRAGRK